MQCLSQRHEQGEVHARWTPPPSRVGGRAVPPSQMSNLWCLPDIGTSVQLAEQMCSMFLQIISEPFVFGFIMHGGSGVGCGWEVAVERSG